MDFKKSKSRPQGRQLFAPQLPRDVSERFRKDYPHSIIFMPRFSRVRYEVLTGKRDCTDPAEDIDNLFPQSLRAASLNPIDNRPSGGSWLHVAVRQGDLPLAHECVRLGTSISFKDRRGYSPLYSGCKILEELRSIVITSCLLPGRRDDPMFAVDIISQTLQICLLLLEHHADPNETHDGLSLLALACLGDRSGDRLNLIRALLIHGAYPSLPSTLPTQLPAQFLQTERTQTDLRPLVSEVANQPRPRRLCPCGFGRPLEECHAAEPQPYPTDGICPCGGAKIHAQCCVKHRDMRWIEKWDMRAERLERLFVPKDTTLLQKFLLLSTNAEELQDTYVLEELAETSRIDPAFAAAGCLVDFQPICPAGVQMLSEIELNESVRLWNEAVDLYISSKIDPREPSDIENAAKVGPEGGPLHRRCEAVGCVKFEGRSGVKLQRCSGCNKTMYCSAGCQKLAWKGHKTACRSGDIQVQMLPSQLEYWAEIMKRLGEGL